MKYCKSPILFFSAFIMVVMVSSIQCMDQINKLIVSEDQKVRTLQGKHLTIVPCGNNLVFYKEFAKGVPKKHQMIITEVPYSSCDTILTRMYFKTLQPDIKRYIMYLMLGDALEHMFDYSFHNGDSHEVGEYPTLSILFSHDGRKALVESGYTLALCLWDVKTGKKLHVLNGHTNSIYSMAFSSDAKMIITGSRDTTACMWNTETGEQVSQLNGHSGAVEAVALNLDGTMAFTGSDDTTGRLWCGKTGLQLLQLNEYSGIASSAAFSPDGTMICVGFDDGAVHVWCIKTGRKLVQFKGHSDTVRSVVFSPDCKTVLTGSRDATVCLWNVKTAQRLLELKDLDYFIKKMVNSAVFNHDGTMIIAGLDYSTVCLWDVKTGQRLLSLSAGGNVLSAVLSADGKTLFVATRAGFVSRWFASPCPCKQWILNGANFLQTWFIAKAAQAKKTAGSFGLRQNSLEMEIFRTLPNDKELSVNGFLRERLSVTNKNTSSVSSETSSDSNSQDSSDSDSSSSKRNTSSETSSDSSSRDDSDGDSSSSEEDTSSDTTHLPSAVYLVGNNVAAYFNNKGQPIFCSMYDGEDTSLSSSNSDEVRFEEVFTSQSEEAHSDAHSNSTSSKDREALQPGSHSDQDATLTITEEATHSLSSIGEETYSEVPFNSPTNSPSSTEKVTHSLSSTGKETYSDIQSNSSSFTEAVTHSLNFTEGVNLDDGSQKECSIQ